MTTCELPGIPKVRSGKVREVFDIGDHFLIVATDRISAFDCVFPDPIPHKGKVLTQLSRFWFEKLDFVPNHVIEANPSLIPDALKPYLDQLSGRSMISRKTVPLPVECVVRGYLAGSGWKEYQQSGAVCGQRLPDGLKLGDRLPEPIFTPATKADSGHDENIPWSQCRHILGDEIALQVRDWSLELYEHGRDFASRLGLVIADTKFEFGMVDDDLILIDECLTPDSSRFWPADSIVPGKSPPSFDKQFVRDYLEATDWDKTPPAPPLPADVIAKTSEKYIEAYVRLTGRKFDPSGFGIFG